jgi:outer membrane protein assembly factor BamB
VSLGCVAPLFGQPTADDWPQFRGPGGLGISSEKGVPTTWSAKQNIVWKTPLPGPGTASPIIIGDRIFVTAFTGYGDAGEGSGNIEKLKRHVLSLRRDNGKILWSKEVPAAQPEQETIRENHGYATSTPVADSERVYVFFGISGVRAFDYDGHELWNADVGSNIGGWGSAASLMLVGDLLIVNASVESESLYAFNKVTGKQVWRATGINDAWNTPLLVTLDNGQQELIVATFGKVLGLDPATGDLLWSCDTDIGWYMVPSLVADNGVVYCIGGRSGGALAVRAGGRGDVTKSHRLWTGTKGSNVSSPLFHEGYLYFVQDSLGVACCTNAETGEVVYEERLEDAEGQYASPVLVDGKIYCVSRSGRTFVLAAKPEFEQLAVNELEERSVFNSSPAVADQRLFLRSDRYLYCIGTK